MPFMLMPRSSVACLLVGLVCALATLMPMPAAPAAEEKPWQAVAPGRIEPASGEIKIATSSIGLIGEVLVKAGDKVAAGDPLIRLTDRVAQARVANAEAQVAMRKRARNDQNPPARAGDRRKAEDAVADGESRAWRAPHRSCGD